MSPKTLFKNDRKLGLERFKSNKAVSQLQAKLKMKGAKNRLLKKQNAKLSKEVAGMRSIHEKHHQKDEGAGKTELDVQEEEIENLKKKIRMSKIDINISELKKTHQDRVRMMKISYENLQRGFEKCQTKLEWMTEEYDELRMVSGIRKSEMGELENENIRLIRKMKQIEKSYSGKHAELLERGKLLEEFEKELETKSASIKMYEHLQNENTELKGRMKVIEGCLTAVQDERSIFKERIRTLLGDLEYSKSRGDEMKKRYEKIKNKMEDLKRDHPGTSDGGKH